MQKQRWVGSGVTALAAAVALAMGQQSATAQAQGQAVTVPMAITENRIQGAQGQVTLTPLGNNQLRVQIRITGLQPNAEHAAHIHGAGQCDTGAAVTHPLTNVKVDGAGVGTSETVVNTAQPAINPQSYVNVHQAANPPGNGVICANVPASISAPAPAATAAPAAPAPAAPAPAVPRVGTGSPVSSTGSIVGALAALATAAAGAGALAVRRRR